MAEIQCHRAGMPDHPCRAIDDLLHHCLEPTPLDRMREPGTHTLADTTYRTARGLLSIALARFRDLGALCRVKDWQACACRASGIGRDSGVVDLREGLETVASGPSARRTGHRNRSVRVCTIRIPSAAQRRNRLAVGFKRFPCESALDSVMRCQQRSGRTDAVQPALPHRGGLGDQVFDCAYRTMKLRAHGRDGR